MQAGDARPDTAGPSSPCQRPEVAGAALMHGAAPARAGKRLPVTQLEAAGFT